MAILVFAALLLALQATLVPASPVVISAHSGVPDPPQIPYGTLCQPDRYHDLQITYNGVMKRYRLVSTERNYGPAQDICAAFRLTPTSPPGVIAAPEDVNAFNDLFGGGNPLHCTGRRNHVGFRTRAAVAYSYTYEYEPTDPNGLPDPPPGVQILGSDLLQNLWDPNAQWVEGSPPRPSINGYQNQKYCVVVQSGNNKIEPWSCDEGGYFACLLGDDRGGPTTTTPPPCQCPPGYTKVCDICVKFLWNWVNWYEARQICRLDNPAANSKLAYPMNQAELDAIQSIMGYDAWIGANDIAVEGSWRYTDTPFAFPSALFHPGDPNNLALGNADCQCLRQDCGFLFQYPSGKVCDWCCLDNKYVVCQADCV